MSLLYVGSVRPFSGKTALCMALARRWNERGLRVGYSKPVSLLDNGDPQQDEDFRVARAAIGPSEFQAETPPVRLGRSDMELALTGTGEGFPARILASLEMLRRSCDVILLEGMDDPQAGAFLGLSGPQVAALAQARALLIAAYGFPGTVDRILSAATLFGNRLLGVVLSGVTEANYQFVREVVTPFLARHGLRIYGAIPTDPLLTVVSVADLAEALGGRVLCRVDLTDQLVETVMVGAMSAENALHYFRRAHNKAVITGGDRVDIQLAALETSTACLILTGDLKPNAIIMGRAEDLGVPIVVASQDTFTALRLVERAMSRIRIHRGERFQQFESLLNEFLDFDGLSADLGLTRAA